MKTVKRIYFYLKWFFPYDREEFPKVYQRGNAMFYGGIVFGFVNFGYCLFAFLKGWPLVPESYFDCAFPAAVVVAIAGRSYIYLHIVKEWVREWFSARRRARWRKLDKTRFYASPMKCHLPLPAAQDIPIAKIRMGQPLRSFIRPGSIERMAESLKVVGLRTPIKVRPLTPEEKAEAPEKDYHLIGGQIRIRAAVQIGWETIKAYVLDLDDRDGPFEAFADNRFPFKPWVTEYEEIWEKFRALPMATMGQLGAVNQRNPQKTRLLLDVLDLLTPKARKMVVDSEMRNEEDMIEMHGYALDDDKACLLAPLSGICHDINLNRRLMERTVKCVIKRELEWEDMEELVGWVKDGFYPEDFGVEAADGLKSWKALDSQDAPWVMPVELAELPEVQSIENQANPYPGVTTTKTTIPVDQIALTPYNRRVIQEGGLKSYIKFIHHCLRLKGLGTSPKTSYEWGAKSVMGWWDLEHQDLFPLFEPGPKRIEEPLYVFYITKVNGIPLRWVAAAEVEDVLRGCHIDAEPFWVKDYTDCVQKGILDRLDKPEGVWSGGIIGRLGVTGVGTEEGKKTEAKRLEG